MDFSINSVNSKNIKFSEFKNNDSRHNCEPNQYTSKPDTLEIKSKTQQSDKLKIWHKILLSAVAIAVTATAIIFRKKKIDAKKLEAETRRLAEESKKKAEERLQKEAQAKAEELRIKAEQEAKLQAEKAAAKARQEAEAKARAEAESRAKIEAERIAREAETIKKINTEFEEKYTIKPYNKSQQNNWEYYQKGMNTIFNGSTEEYLQGIVNAIKKAEREGVPSEKISKIYERIKECENLTEEQIGSIVKSYDNTNFQYFLLTIKNKLKARKQLIQDLERLQRENPQQQNEEFSDYIKRLINKNKENAELQKQQRIQTIKSRLIYSESASDNANIQLTAEEIEELREALIKRKIANADKEYIKKASPEELIRDYIRESTEDYDAPEVSDRIQQACFSRLPRYNSKTSPREYDFGRDNTFEHEPLYRWMYMGRKCEEFTNETFKVGEIYTFPKKQSCSKNMKIGETEFRDDNTSMNFKYVIHPKSETSRALDMGHGHYGCNEAVYNKGEKFRVVDIYDEEIIIPGDNEASKSFYRKVVHLQEL